MCLVLTKLALCMSGCLWGYGLVSFCEPTFLLTWAELVWLCYMYVSKSELCFLVHTCQICIIFLVDNMLAQEKRSAMVLFPFASVHFQHRLTYTHKLTLYRYHQSEIHCEMLVQVWTTKLLVPYSINKLGIGSFEWSFGTSWLVWLIPRQHVPLILYNQ